MKWYAVYTRPGCERKVAESLNRRKIPNYCPLNRKRKNGSSSLVTDPLFKSFVFVKVSEDQIPTILEIENVVNFVYWHEAPAVINEPEVELMRSFVDNHINVNFERITVNPTEAARYINRSILLNHASPIHFENKTVTAILPSFGYMLKAEPMLSKEKGYQQRNSSDQTGAPSAYSMQ